MNISHEWQAPLIEDAEEYCIWCGQTTEEASEERCPRRWEQYGVAMEHDGIN